MQVNLDCNCPKPQFGMAFRRPEGKNMGKLADYLSLDKEINRKGFAQYIKELKKQTRYDVDYIASTNMARVIDNKTDEVVSSFFGVQNVTGYSHLGESFFPAKKFFTKLIDPKQFLPYNFILAGERAQELESKAIASEASTKTIDKIL